MSIKKRVLVLTSTFPRWEGDTEPPFVFELCRRLGERFDVVVLAPHADGSRRFERIGGIEVKRFRYFLPRWEKLAYQGGILANLKRSRWCYLLLPFYFFAQLVALRQILREQHIDLIHAHWLIPQGLTVAISGVFVKNMPPFLCTSHGGDLLGLNGRLFKLIKSWIINRSSFLTVVSNTMADYALKLGVKPTRVKIISMGINTKTLFTPAPAIHRVDNEILFVGRLVEKKGCSFLINAIPKILQRYPDVRLSVVGSGPEQEVLVQQVKQLDIPHAVTFYGAVGNADTAKFYQRSTIFAAPSIITSRGDQEGLGLVITEASSCACPIITTDLPAIRDVVIDGVTGLICQQKNSTDLAEKICFLLENPELRKSLGEAGRRHVEEHFDWEIITHRYATLFDDLIREQP